MKTCKLRDSQIKKCPKTDAKILSLCSLCLCGSFIGIVYFLQVPNRVVISLWYTAVSALMRYKVEFAQYKSCPLDMYLITPGSAVYKQLTQ
jgi:hypothetical protein